MDLDLFVVVICIQLNPGSIKGWYVFLILSFDFVQQ